MIESLDLALVGNGTIGALISADAEIVWTCFPGFDGDPVFCSLLRGSAEPAHDGSFSIELVGCTTKEQGYVSDSPILTTRFYDAAGSAISVTDFAPRAESGGNVVAPMMIVRRIERLSGDPLIRIRVRPVQNYGEERIAHETLDDCVRYSGNRLRLRLTTNAPIEAIENETPFPLIESVTLVLGADEDPGAPVQNVGARVLERTLDWWREWVASLNVPPEYRNEVVRAAITLQMNVVDNTGGIIAAMTTSIPEAPHSTRNWDYRYCWLRDAYFVIDALYRLGDKRTMERYVDFIRTIVESSPDARLVPLYSATGAPVPPEHEATHLNGYRDTRPVRVGNLAHLQKQNDVYGEVILSTLPLYLDSPASRAPSTLFEQLERLGTHAANLHDKPDAGLWELRGKERIHTFSSVLCWAACAALARIAAKLNKPERADHWSGIAAEIRRQILDRAWNPRIGAFTAAFEGTTLDASVLLLHALGFIDADDPRYVSTVRVIGRDLRRGDFIYRYTEEDDFGRPENAFLVCTFWYIDALAAIGDRGDARRLFEHVLSCRNRHGLLAEHVDPRTREQWGNFVQTYSMAGIIQSALRLSTTP